MVLTLENRTADSVRIYFEKANRPEIKRVLPQKAKTVEEALEDYEKTLLPDATSFGQTVYADGKYIGDVWCYCIDMEDEPNCMLSLHQMTLRILSSMMADRQNLSVHSGLLRRSPLMPVKSAGEMTAGLRTLITTHGLQHTIIWSTLCMCVQARVLHM